jgi:hypothetical protein
METGDGGDGFAWEYRKVQNTTAAIKGREKHPIKETVDQGRGG